MNSILLDCISPQVHTIDRLLGTLMFSAIIALAVKCFPKYSGTQARVWRAVQVAALVVSVGAIYTFRAQPSLLVNDAVAAIVWSSFALTIPSLWDLWRSFVAFMNPDAVVKATACTAKSNKQMVPR